MQLHETTEHIDPAALVSLTPRFAFADVLIQTVLDGLTSEHSKRAYARHLRAFIDWHQASGHTEINKAVVQRYAAQLRDAGMSPQASIKGSQPFASSR